MPVDDPTETTTSTPTETPPAGETPTETPPVEEAPPTDAPLTDAPAGETPAGETPAAKAARLTVAVLAARLATLEGRLAAAEADIERLTARQEPPAAPLEAAAPVPVAPPAVAPAASAYDPASDPLHAIHGDKASATYLVPWAKKHGLPVLDAVDAALSRGWQVGRFPGDADDSNNPNIGRLEALAFASRDPAVLYMRPRTAPAVEPLPLPVPIAAPAATGQNAGDAAPAPADPKTVLCPVCMASPGDGCRSKGATVAEVHEARLDAVRKMPYNPTRTALVAP